MLGLYCRSDQLDRPDCQMFPTERDQLLVDYFYSSATRLNPIAARALKTPRRLQPDWQPYRCSSIPISTGSLHDLFTNSSINTRFLHEQYLTSLIFAPLFEGQILRFSDLAFFSFNRQKMMSKVYMNVIFAITTHLLAIAHGRIVMMFYGPKIVHRLLPLILLSVTS